MKQSRKCMWYAESVGGSEKEHKKHKRHKILFLCLLCFLCFLCSRLFYLRPKTHTAPPCGTSGNSPGRAVFRTPCMATGSTPQPDWTAMYCLPSIENEVG